MSLASLVALLQTVFTLLSLVNANPALPRSTRDHVQQVVQQAITQATDALASQAPAAPAIAMSGTVATTSQLTASTMLPQASVTCSWNGQTIANGASVTAYQAASVPSGSTCVSQTRTCTNGTLSGSYGFGACTVLAPSSSSVAPAVTAARSIEQAYLNIETSMQTQLTSCTAAQENMSTITSNVTAATYDLMVLNNLLSSAKAATGQSDQNTVIQQLNTLIANHSIHLSSDLSGPQQQTMQYATSCGTAVPAAVAAESIERAYLDIETGMQSNLQSCAAAQSSMSTIGTNVTSAKLDLTTLSQLLDSAKANASDSNQSSVLQQLNTLITNHAAHLVSDLPGPQQQAMQYAVICMTSTNTPAACSWNGSTIPRGQSVAAYQTPSVSSGARCVSEQRACNNGTLSGSYQYASCATLAAQLDPSAISIRLGRPTVVRVDSKPDELDNNFNAIQLPNGKVRGFLGFWTSYAVDGSSIYDMGGLRTTVLTATQGGSYASCGVWMQGVHYASGKLWGLIHNETQCGYSNGVYGVLQSMSIGTSNDYGLTWNILGQAFTGSSNVKYSSVGSGVGNGTMIDAGDGYVYVYATRDSSPTIAARAPTTDLSPANWRAWDGSGWNASPLNGGGASLGWVGSAAGFWKDQNAVVLARYDVSSLQLLVSTDKIHFQTVSTPMADYYYPSNDSTMIAQYPSIVSEAGSNTFSNNHFILTYALSQGAHDPRYLVMQDVWLNVLQKPTTQPTGTALTRWLGPGGSRRTTTSPVIGNGSTWTFEKDLGYLLTGPDSSQSTAKLEECVYGDSTQPDYILSTDGTCVGNGYTRLGTAGWLYTTQQPGTQPLYRCHQSIAGGRYLHFDSPDSQCENVGTSEGLQGYILSL